MCVWIFGRPRHATIVGVKIWRQLTKIANSPNTNHHQIFSQYGIHTILVGCKHRTSEVLLYIGGRGFVLWQFIELVTFACCAFIFALRNIALGGYLYTPRNILEDLWHDVRPETTYIYIYRKKCHLTYQKARFALNYYIIYYQYRVLPRKIK